MFENCSLTAAIFINLKLKKNLFWGLVLDKYECLNGYEVITFRNVYTYIYIYLGKRTVSSIPKIMFKHCSLFFELGKRHFSIYKYWHCD